VKLEGVPRELVIAYLSYAKLRGGYVADTSAPTNSKQKGKMVPGVGVAPRVGIVNM